MTDLKQLLTTAELAAESAAEILLRHFGHVRIHEKSSQNLVTQADFESEALIAEIIARRHPGHATMLEEGESTGSIESEHLWVVDPLDATNNYAHGLPHFCISIGYAYRGEMQIGVVLDPTRRELFSAIRGQGARLNGQPIQVSAAQDLTQCLIATGFYYERGDVMLRTLDAMRGLFFQNVRGIRRIGAAALDLAWVACGRMEGYFEYRLSPWDFAAGWLIVEEAGGRCVDSSEGQLTLQSKGLIASCPGIATSLRGVVGWKED